MKKRRIEIDSILRKLREFENDSRYGGKLYAIEENSLILSEVKQNTLFKNTQDDNRGLGW